MKRSLGPDSARVARDLDALAAIGKLGEGAVRRLAFTPEDMKARDYVINQMKQTGLEVRLDAFGNIFGRRAGLDAERACVIFGSHIDTTAVAGRFDGTVGVVGALEVMRLLNDNEISTRRPLEVVVFAAEESTRFGVSLLGSRATAGRLTAEHLHRLEDNDSMSLWHALKRVGLHPEALSTCVLQRGYARAYLELHIEQGPVLESLGRPIGVVTAIAAPTRGIVTVRGQAAHSGATPMRLRRDALTAAAEAVLGLERIAREEAAQGTVATVGILEVRPGALNTIPGEAQFTADIRSADAASKRRAVGAFRGLLDRLARERGVAVDFVATADNEPVLMAPAIVETVDRACRDLGIVPHYMPSGGGHDAQEVALYADAGMIFVPSVGGLSHTPEEYTPLDSICLGMQVLTESVRRLAE
jgi:N-carbamoyl-L-amino-acid hydrolase